MTESSTDWPAQLAQLRRRVEELRALGPPPPLRGDEGWAALSRIRHEAQGLLEPIAAAYRGFCPDGFPLVEDNQIEGPGGSIGVRFGPKHAVFIALEHEAKRKSVEAKPAGLAGALGVRTKRMPGDPLPPRDPQEPLELVVLGLRWDDDRGWVEVRRRLDPRWDARVLREHLAAYLVGLNYDIAAGLLRAG